VLERYFDQLLPIAREESFVTAWSLARIRSNSQVRSLEFGENGTRFRSRASADSLRKINKRRRRWQTRQKWYAVCYQKIGLLRDCDGDDTVDKFWTRFPMFNCETTARILDVI